MNDYPVPAILNDLLSMNADMEGYGGISTCLPAGTKPLQEPFKRFKLFERLEPFIVY